MGAGERRGGQAGLTGRGGDSRVLLRLAAGQGYPVHAHAVPDEVFVVEGTYVDPGVA
ncbi:hypothetical protein H9L05_21075 (plasmid) [Hymenobacter qilianensis]|uniref:Cupin domain-containing protein n=1 Tax=Hymenobacter qilianensis TaxID=1385715 RepID=A0A7H0H1A9_9BACT|nr:hypothetical protein [Hymenobacter qilianensis]QNP54325.1 hypothetical protein H9L05_21075 [Hymenobacter qilianensis]